ncbi:MAG: hypothetical protein ACI849_000020 [Patiriisocius sp.]|jgi:hypothetical protein
MNIILLILSLLSYIFETSYGITIAPNYYIKQPKTVVSLIHTNKKDQHGRL